MGLQVWQYIILHNSKVLNWTFCSAHCLVNELTGNTDLSFFSAVLQATFVFFLHTHMHTTQNQILIFTFLLKVFCRVLQHEYIFKNPIKREWWHRTRNSQRNRIPKCMSLKVKYFVKIAINVKSLRQNGRAYCGRHMYTTILYFLTDVLGD